MLSGAWSFKLARITIVSMRFEDSSHATEQSSRPPFVTVTVRYFIAFWFPIKMPQTLFLLNSCPQLSFAWYFELIILTPDIPNGHSFIDRNTLTSSPFFLSTNMFVVPCSKRILFTQYCTVSRNKNFLNIVISSVLPIRWFGDFWSRCWPNWGFRPSTELFKVLFVSTNVGESSYSLHCLNAPEAMWVVEALVVPTFMENISISFPQRYKVHKFYAHLLCEDWSW